MQIIFTGRNLTEAHIVAGMLRAEGIEAHVGGHYLQGAVGDLAPMDFARVMISSDDRERASELVREYNRDREMPATDGNQPDIYAAAAAATEPEPDTSEQSLAWVGWLLAGMLFLFLLRWAM